MTRADRTGEPKTWEAQLFDFLDDIEGQAEAVLDTERAYEVADRARGEYANVTLASRLMASVGNRVTLRLVGVGDLSGRLGRVAAGWCLIESAGQEWIIPVSAIAVARGLSPRSVPEEAWPVTARLGLGSALRRVTESGEPAQVRLLDGGHYTATPLRVGQDLLEAAVGEYDEAMVIPFAALCAVHTRR